jgi:acetylornithine deacetylase/succinyl-diaminopimelate desuccinylase-like protein
MEQMLPHQVPAHIDQAAMVELDNTLIRIPSFKSEETPAVQFLADFFRPRGYQLDLHEIEPGRFQTSATLKGSEGGVIRGNADEDDSCVLISDMVKVTQVLALTALDACKRDRI